MAYGESEVLKGQFDDPDHTSREQSLGPLDLGCSPAFLTCKRGFNPAEIRGRVTPCLVQEEGCLLPLPFRKFRGTDGQRMGQRELITLLESRK